MSLNATGLELATNALQAGLLYAQLHSAAAGTEGTDNTVGGRQAIQWSAPVDGEFGLLSQILFRGDSNAVAYSLTLWDAEEDGTLYGEFTLAGDGVFNAQGEYAVTVLDFTLTVA